MFLVRVEQTQYRWRTQKCFYRLWEPWTLA